MGNFSYGDSRTGRDREPYKSQPAVSGFTNRIWVNEGDKQLDFGAVVLPDEKFSNKVGWFRYGSFVDKDLPGLTANLAGYPVNGPVPYDCPHSAPCQQWFYSDTIPSAMWSRSVNCPAPPDPCTVITKGIVNYRIDATPGQSGAPVWLYNGPERKERVVAGLSILLIGETAAAIQQSVKLTVGL